MTYPLSRRVRGGGLTMLALEPRWMFDAAAADVATDIAVAASIPQHTQVQAAEPASNDGRLEVVFIDSSVPNWQELVSAIHSGVEIELIDSSKNGLAQIAAWAASHSGYDSIAVVSHGGTGWFSIGSTTVDAAALSDATARENLTDLGQALKNTGSLLIYGCDVARGDTGYGFIAALGELIGRSVSASTDTTGGTGLGGDWELEATYGLPYSATSINAPGWTHILAAPALSENFTTISSLSSSWTYLRSGWTGTFLSSTYGAILTNNGNVQSADLIYNAAFDSSAGIDLRFTYYMGPNLTSGADGLSFFLLDGTTSLVTSFNTGALGPGLGYAANVTEPGISGGVLGIGFDQWGNYSGTAAGTGSPGPLNSNNATYSGNIVVRGSGDEATSTTGYAYLTGVQPNSSGNPQAPGSGSTSFISGEHAVEVILAINGGNGHFELTVKLDNITQINAYDLTAAGITVPSTLMFGFGASTGGSTNINAIKSVSVFTAAAAADAVWPTFTSATAASVSVDTGTPLDLSSYLHASDTDTGQTLTWTQSSAPSHGTLSFVGATASTGSTDVAPGGTLTYTPTAGYTGTDSFTVQVSDGTTWSTKTINVTVDKAPTFVAASQALTVDTNSAAIDVRTLLRVSDTDSGQTLTWSQSAAPSHGTLTVSSATASSGGTAIDAGGTLTYTPAVGYTGTDSFTVAVSDGLKTVQRTITVTVRTPTPVAPVVQSPTQQSDPAPAPANVSISPGTGETGTPGLSIVTTTATTPTPSSTQTGTPDGLNSAVAALTQSLPTTSSVPPPDPGTGTGTNPTSGQASSQSVTPGTVTAPSASPSLPSPGSTTGLSESTQPTLSAPADPSSSDAAAQALPASSTPSTPPATQESSQTGGETASSMAAALAAGTLPVSSSSGRSDSANDAYARALTNALADGRSLSEAANLAQQAASAQAAADAASGDPNAALASGNNVLAALGAEASSSLYQQALGAELARGSTLAQAQAAARAAEAGLSETNNDPATMMATALATGRIGNLMNNMSGPASSAFERTLSGALARGASVAEALAQARDAATQADGLDGASRGNALAELAADAKRTGGGNEGPAYDRALSSALAAGLPLDLAQTRAREAARIMAAATGERMTEADALASGRRLDEVLGDRAKNPTFMTAFNRALAAGKDVRSAIAEADRAARQAANAEQGQDRLREALATGRQVDPAKVPHSGDLVGPAKALFDRVLGRVLQTGAPLAEAVAKANDAVAEFQATEDAAAKVPPSPPIPLRAQAGR